MPDKYITRESNRHKTNIPLKVSLRFQIPRGKAIPKKRKKERNIGSTVNNREMNSLHTIRNKS